MDRHVVVRQLPEAREVEVAPFPIGEVPHASVRPPVDEAERILGPAPVPYEFRASPTSEPVARAARLSTFVETLRDAPVDTLEWGLHGGSMERWVGDVLGDAVLRRELAGLRFLALYGEPLRTSLYTTARSRLVELTE